MICHADQRLVLPEVNNRETHKKWSERTFIDAMFPLMGTASQSLLLLSLKVAGSVTWSDNKQERNVSTLTCFDFLFLKAC